MQPLLLLLVTAVADTGAAVLDRLTGAYRLPNGHHIAVARFESSLSFTESLTGRSGILRRRTDTTFVAGRTLDAGSPVDIRATFALDSVGRVSALRWSAGGRAPVLAMRVAHREEEARYAGGGITFGATLVLPEGAGPYPALVLVTGAGPALRNQFGALPYLLASQGLSVLMYDKRGSGATTGTFGDWLSIDTLAADALAGVRYLTTRPDIDTMRIGMLGASQGGWVVPLAASQSSRIAFIVLKSASALPTWENTLYEVDNTLRFAGVPERDVARAHRAGAVFNAMVRSRGGPAEWSALRDTLLAVRGQRWANFSRLPDTLPATAASANLRWVEREFRAGFDPRPVWETITIPVLILNGGLDENVPGKESAELISTALQKAGNRDFIVRVYDRADHWGWEVTRLGRRTGRSHQPGVPEMLRWISERAGKGSG